MSVINERTVVYPSAPYSSEALQMKFMKINDAHLQSIFEGGVPLVKVDYREFAVEQVFERAFSTLFIPTGVSWIDNILLREGYVRSFKDNMMRMLRTGEYFAFLGVRNGKIFIDRIPEDEVTICVVSEKTGELELFVYVEPIVIFALKQKLAWRRVTWTPTTFKIEVSLEDDPKDNESFRVQRIDLNPYGFVPIVPFKLGTQPRGIPIWKPAESVINTIEDVFNDIRFINAYHAAPQKWMKTDGDYKGINPDGIIIMGQEDEIGVLTYNQGNALHDEFVTCISIMSDLLGIPVTSLLQVGKHASGEAIEKRLDTLTRKAKNLREFIGVQMELMFRMMCAFISQGLVSVDLNDKNIVPILTNQVMSNRSSPEEKEQAYLIYVNNMGNPVDLSAYTVPDIKWIPIEKINPQDMYQLVQGLNEAKEGNLMSESEARKVLEWNLDALLVVADLETIDEAEMLAEAHGRVLMSKA